jgi:hypothetical protein
MIQQEEENLNEIVQLVGKDALADKEKIILEAVRVCLPARPWLCSCVCVRAHWHSCE